MPNNNKKITIIGAGLTGVMLSIVLAKRGYKVVVCEKREDSQIFIDKKYDSGRSLSLDISLRGFKALSEIGLMDKIYSHIVPMRDRVIHLPEKQILSIPYGKGYGHYINTVSRNTLHQELIELAESMEGIKIKFNQEFISFDHVNNKVILMDSSEQKERQLNSDIVIGCDGVNSRVRDWIEKISGIYFSKKPFDYNYKVFKIPKEHASKMTFEAMHMWPRESAMLVAQPNFDGAFMCALLLPTKGNKSFSSIISRGERFIEEFLRSNFDDAYPLIPDVSEEFINNLEGSFTTIKGGKWSSQNKVLLLGDAIHGMLPFLGQGVNCCFEDCYLLNKYLDVFNDDWDYIIPKFEQDRQNNTDAITTMSLENYPELTNINWKNVIIERQVENFLMEQYKDFYISYHNLICFEQVPYSYAANVRFLQKELIANITSKIKDISELSEELTDDNVLKYLKKKKALDAIGVR